MLALGECSNSSSNSHSRAPSTPPPPRPSHLSATSPPQLTKDVCFSCKRVGHWARECPSKTPQRAHPSTAGSSSSSSPSPPMESCHLPVIRCPCGGGACRVRTANNDKNHNRKYYACPLGRSRNCDYFGWCDEVAKHEVPPCPCGAGICSLNRELSGPNVGKWYFACRIKKNHGACRFYCLVDFELDALLNKHLDRIKGSSSPRCLSTDQHTLNTTNYDLNEEEHFKSGSSRRKRLLADKAEDIKIEEIVEGGAREVATGPSPAVWAHSQPQVKPEDVDLEEVRSEGHRHERPESHYRALPIRDNVTGLIYPATLAEDEGDCFNLHRPYHQGSSTRNDAVAFDLARAAHYPGDEEVYKSVQGGVPTIMEVAMIDLTRGMSALSVGYQALMEHSSEITRAWLRAETAERKYSELKARTKEKIAAERSRAQEKAEFDLRQQIEEELACWAIDRLQLERQQLEEEFKRRSAEQRRDAVEEYKRSARF